MGDTRSLDYSSHETTIFHMHISCSQAVISALLQARADVAARDKAPVARLSGAEASDGQANGG